MSKIIWMSGPGEMVAQDKYLTQPKKTRQIIQSQMAPDDYIVGKDIDSGEILVVAIRENPSTWKYLKKGQWPYVDHVPQPDCETISSRLPPLSDQTEVRKSGPERLFRWPSFKNFDLELSLQVVPLPSGKRCLVFNGGDRYPGIMTQLGFRYQGEAGVWVKPGAIIPPEDMPVWNNCFRLPDGRPGVVPVKTKAVDIVRRPGRQKRAEREKKIEHIELSNDSLIKMEEFLSSLRDIGHEAIEYGGWDWSEIDKLAFLACDALNIDFNELKESKYMKHSGSGIISIKGSIAKIEITQSSNHPSVILPLMRGDKNERLSLIAAVAVVNSYIRGANNNSIHDINFAFCTAEDILMEISLKTESECEYI